MLRVRICINERVVVERQAVRKTHIHAQPKPDDVCTYRTDDGRMIEHRYGDGAEELARKLLTPEDDQ